MGRDNTELLADARPQLAYGPTSGLAAGRLVAVPVGHRRDNLRVADSANQLRQTLVTTGAAIRAVAAELFAAAGVREPHQRAADFAAFIDGLLFHQIAGAGSRQLTRADLRATMATLLAAVTNRRS
jgi:hypothetical protein